MGIKTIILFKKKKFYGFKELIDFYNINKSGIFKQKTRNVEQQYSKFIRKNNRIPNNIEIDNILKTRAEKNFIKYNNILFSGPKQLYNYLNESEITYKGFHRNYINFKKKFPKKKLTSKIIRSFNKKTKKNVFKNYWESTKKPKVGWTRALQKLGKFKKEFKKQPSESQFRKLIEPITFEWLQKNSTYENKNGKQISLDEFYSSFNFNKISLNGFKKRINAFIKRNKRKINYNEAIDLLKPWGKVNAIAGYLYKYKNLKNNKIYIGITTQTVKERIRGHIRNSLKSNLSKNSLDFAIKKFGIKNFTIQTVARFNSFKKLADAETYYIKKYKSLYPNGYNLDIGGRGLGLKKYPIELNGKFYNNLVTIAEDYNIPVKRLESRLRLGFKLEEAVTNSKFLTRKQIKKGFKKTIPEYAKDYNIGVAKVYERLSRGWSLEESLEIKNREIDLSDRYNSKKLNIEGRKFSSQSSAAKFYGLTHQTFFKRLKRGWTVRQALGIDERKK
jgi:group I intron endonuclease|tara:strand:+ start:120 stop:1625 length:1506 start_codon:yes stop_codon:yes gene_type:complete